MAGIFDVVPQRILREARSICEVVKTKRAQDGQIQLLFALIGGRVEVVERKSMRGIWLLLTSQESLKLGLERIQKLAERMKSIELSPSDQEVMETLQSAAQIFSPPPVPKPRITPLLIDRHVSEVAGEALLTEVELRATRLKAAATSLGIDAEIGPLVMEHLQSYPDIDSLLCMLEEAEQHPQRAINALDHALSRALITARDDEIEAFERVLRSLDKVRPTPFAEEELTSSVTIDNLGLVLGDAFIRGSGKEGGTTSRIYAELASQALQESSLPQDRVRALGETLSHGVDLRAQVNATQVRDDIRRTLSSLPRGQQRCLLFGGWSQHAIVYEIEKQTDGTYAFRIYNEGEGLSFHFKIQEKYKEKYAGCIAIQNIPEHLILAPTFLACLQHLCKIREGAPDILLGNILPLLDGQDEAMDPRMQHFVSPQRSGTCTYRSLQAFFAHSLKADEYSLWKFEYKLFLLKRYLPALQKKAAEPIVGEEAYYEHVLEYGIVKRSLEKFSSGIHKLTFSLSLEQRKQASAIIARYEASLKTYLAEIVCYEREYFGQPLSDLKGNVITGIINPESLITFASPVQPEEVTDVKPVKRSPPLWGAVSQIDTMRVPEDGVRILDLLEALLADSSPAEEKRYAIDLFLKKIGPLDMGEKIASANPERAIKLLSRLFSWLATAPRLSDLQRWSMCGTVYYIAERIFRNLETEKRVLAKDFPSFLGKSSPLSRGAAIEHDPFWVDRYSELTRIRNQQSKRTLYRLPVLPEKGSLAFLEESMFFLSREMCSDIVSWWEKDPSRMQLVNASIERDRSAQEKKIEIWTRQVCEERDQAITKKAGLEGAKSAMAPEDWAKAFEEVTKHIDQLNLLITQIPERVHNDPEYWPWGWEQPDFPIANKANFIFGNHPFFTHKMGVDPVPEALRTLFAMAFLMQYAGKIDPDNLRIAFEEQYPGNVKRDQKTGEINLVHPTAFLKHYASGFGRTAQNEYARYYKQKEEERPRTAENRGWVALLGKLEEQRFSWRWKGEPSAPSAARLFVGAERPPMNTEQVTDLISLSSGRDVAIESLISYFSEHFEKLSETNWFVFAHFLLFGSDLLLHGLRDDTQRDRLISFLHTSLDQAQKNAIQLGDIRLAANLLWVTSTVQRYIDFVAKERHLQIPPIFSPDAIIPLMEVATSNPRYAKHLPVVFEAVVAACSKMREKQLSETTLGYLCIANALQQRFCVSRENAIPMRARDAEEVMYTTHNVILTEAIAMPLQRLLQRVFPGIAFQKSEDFPTALVSTDGTTSIELSSGTIHSTHPLVADTASSVMDPAVADYLKAHKWYSADDDLSTSMCSRKGDVMYVYDQKYNRTLRIWSWYTPGQKTIDLKITANGKTMWADEIAENARPPLGNLALHRGYHWLCAASDPADEVQMQLVSHDTQRLTYEVDRHGRVRESSSGLYLVDSPKMGVFARFESPSCTTFLADDTGTVQKISFPRLDLSFRCEGKDRWVCDQQKEWRIAPNQWAPHLAPHTGFLVLENDKGEKKVLLPVWDATEVKTRALNFPFLYDFDEVRSEKGRLLTYTLVDDRLEPSSLEARMYLGRIYLEKGFQDAAEALMYDRQAEITYRALTGQEAEALKKFACVSQSGNTSARALRLRLHALALLEKDRRCSLGEKEPPSEYDPLKGVLLMTDYLNRLGHIPPLDLHEELLLLERFRTLPYVPSAISARYAECTADGPINSPPPTPSRAKEPPRAVTGGDRVWTEAMRPQVAARSSVHRCVDAVRYRLARLSSTFPFDATDPDKWEELYTFFPMVKAEVQQTLSLEVARSTNLLSTLQCIVLGTPLSREARFTQERYRELLDSLYAEKPPLTREKARIPLYTATVRPSGIALQRKERKSLGLQSDHMPLHDAFAELQTLENHFAREQATAKKMPNLFSSASVEASDVATKQQFANLRADLASAIAITTEKRYTLSPKVSLESLRDTLSPMLGGAKKVLATQEETIIRSVTGALTLDPTSALQFSAKKRALPSMSELCLLSARMDNGAALKEAFPELLPDIEALQQAIQEYLLQKRLVQHLNRTIQNIDAAIFADPEAEERLISELGATIHAFNQYGPKKAQDALGDLAMVALIVETTFDIKLRPDQIENIEKLRQDKNIVLQMIMGSGKTAILQPILAFLFARPGTLSTVCVPESLIGEVLEGVPGKPGLVGKLGATFGRLVFSMPFTRQLAKDEAYLSAYLEQLEEAKSRGAILLLTPQQKYALYSGLKEAYAEGVETRCTMLAKICELMQKDEYAQIDEIHMVEDPQVVYKFTIGESKPLPQAEAEAACEMVLQLAEDPEFCKRVSIDFIDKFQSKRDTNYLAQGKEPSSHLYPLEILPKLKEIALNILRNKDPTFYATLIETARGKEYLEHFLTQQEERQNEADLSHEGLSDVQRAIKERTDYIKERNSWLDERTREHPAFRAMLGTVAKATNQILTKSLFKLCGAHYGNTPKAGAYTACPYYAPGKPKRSIPSDPAEHLIYSAQNILFNGVPRTVVTEIMKKWQKEALEAFREFGTAFDSTPAYEEFKRLLGPQAAYFSFSETPPQDALIDALQRAISADGKAIRSVLQNFVYPQITFYDTTITTTPQTLTGLCKRWCGYTGTMNEGILPYGATAEAAIGTDGTTIAAIEEKIQRGSSAIQEYSRKAGSYLDQVREVFKGDRELFVFIDSGNWLKDEPLLEWGKALLQGCHRTRPEICAILMPDEEDKWISIEYSESGDFARIPIEQSTMKPEQRLTIIPSRKETGTDILQPPNAKAMDSIRKGMVLSDLLQSAFRMRGILLGQEIVFCLSQEVKEHIASEFLCAAFAKEPYASLLEQDYLALQQALKTLPDIFEGATQLKDTLAHIRKDQWDGRGAMERIGAARDILSQHFSCASDTFWNYLAKNQTVDRKEKTWQAALQKMQQVVEAPIMRALCNTKIPFSERHKLFLKLADLFTPKTTHDPFRDMIQESACVPAHEGVAHEVAHMEAFLNKVFEADLSDAIQSSIRSAMSTFYPGSIKEALHACVDINAIPDSVIIGLRSAGAGDEVEVEREITEEREVAEERDIALELEVEAVPTSPLDERQYFELLSYTEDAGYNVAELFTTPSIRGLLPIDSLLPQGTKELFSQPDYDIKYSKNLFSDNKLSSPYHLPCNYLLLCRNPPNKELYLLISHEDAGRFKRGLLQSALPPPQSVHLISLDGNVCATSGGATPASPDDAPIQRAIVQAKLLTGRIRFSEKELAIVRELLNKSGARGVAIARMYEDILTHMPETKKRYPTSALKKVFAEVR